MSVKLPLIVKRQIKPSTPKKSQAPQDQQEPLHNNEPQQQEVDYQEDQFEQQPHEESHQPVETITVLKKEESSHNQLHVKLNNHHSKQIQETPSNNNEKRIEELRKILQEKIQTANSLKENVTERKKEIKNIGEQIDKDLNKTLLKTKQNAVNIRDIFSAPPKSNNKQVNDLNDELKHIRITIKKTKAEIQKLSNSFMDPITQLNQQKGVDFENRIKTADEQIRHIQKQKELLSEQISRGGKQFNEEEDKARSDEISKLNVNLLELITSQKQYKTNTYQIEKEDILLMEKIKFFQEREGVLGQSKKSKPTQKEKMKLDEQIRQLIEQVNEIIEDRNKIEVQKKSMVKNLTAQISTLQSKNWDLCNKLRQIDSFLLQYYQKKSKKKEVKIISDRISNNSELTIMQKSISGKIQAQSLHVQSGHKTIQYQNDKNKKSSAEIVLVQKKKVYEFTHKEILSNQISLSDQFLGNKLNIVKIILNADQKTIYSMQVVYQQQFKQQIQGYLMGSKSTPQNCETIQIKLNRQILQIINFIHVGHHQDHSVSFLHIITTEGKQYKWGNSQKIGKSDQKHIKKYQFCSFKTKIIPNEENAFCLSGIILSTIYLGTK